MSAGVARKETRLERARRLHAECLGAEFGYQETLKRFVVCAQAELEVGTLVRPLSVLSGRAWDRIVDSDDLTVAALVRRYAGDLHAVTQSGAPGRNIGNIFTRGAPSIFTKQILSKEYADA